MIIEWVKHDLNFLQAARTSRNTLINKPSYFIKLTDTDSGRVGWGECSLIPGLSIDDQTAIEAQLSAFQSAPSLEQLQSYKDATLPALQFAIETAVRSFNAEHPFTLFDSPFSRGEAGITINGLIWMANENGILEQMRARAKEGFRILKMKIGASDFNAELQLLKRIRDEFPPDTFELRLDANGAFAPNSALRQLEQLAQFEIHSIEQPIRQGQHDHMAHICAKSPIPIALDEELIGVAPNGELLEQLAPKFLILKPSLIGGLDRSKQWADLAAQHGIGWWATSALESNIGLNAIAQWCAVQENTLPQGLGTGRLFSNNVIAPLEVKNAELWLNDTLWSPLP